jgi:hypothetical protein
MHFVVDSGWRPVVSASIDGVEVPMLVHANAGFLGMLTHAALHRVTGRRVHKDTDFGLGPDLKLSSAGRGAAEVDSLTVAGHSMRGVRLEVFDLPTTNWEGMLGVDWLAASGAIVDFGSRVLTVPRTPSDRPTPSLRGRQIPLERDETSGRWTCRLSLLAPSTVPASGRFVVSTVAETALDIAFAARSGIDLGDPVEEEHGPTGAVVPVYRPVQPVALGIRDEVFCAVPPSIYDIYGYGGNPRPPDEECLAGYLGADVLLRTRALVDFAAG